MWGRNSEDRANNVEIRDGAIDDTDILARIGAQSFREAYASHSSHDDLELHINRHFSATAVRDEIQLNDHSYLLATIDGHGGGIAKYCRAPCPVSGGDDNAFALKQLYVLDSAQGNGLGRRLVSNLEDIARRAKANGIWLSVWESADWATGFYRSIGFEEIGKVDFKLGKATYTDSLMWMPLD